jgi:hypothetical protein
LAGKIVRGLQSRIKGKTRKVVRARDGSHVII